MHPDNLYLFESAASSASVDAAKGIIYGVSLITSGITAKGHDLEVDDTTLEQMLSCAEKKKKIPVKWNHKTGADAISGYIKNFRIEGRKLVGDWHLLKSHERYQHALELATEMPECLGLSTSFRGKDEEIGERKFARCSDLVSADLVASPAANPNGFFETGSGLVDSSGKNMADKPNSTGAALESQEKNFSMADVMAGIAALNTSVQGLGERMTQFEAFQEDLLAGLEEGEEHEFEEADEDEEGLIDFSNGAEALQYLSEKLAGIEDAKERAQIERAFAAYDEKVETLLELNEQLALENQAMAEALKEFQEDTGREVRFSAGADGGYEHSLAERHESGRKLTEFEAAVAVHVKAGKAETDAINLARKENYGRYQKHLQEIGVLARSL